MKKLIKDHLDRQIELNFPPKKIISLVPSQTELLYDLGLDKEIVGITRFCIHPKNKFKEKTKIGGTKKFDFKKINVLKPDLIIANKEENYKEGIEELSKSHPVWVSEIYTFEDNLKMIMDVGKICNKQEKATKIIKDIKNNFQRLKIDSKRKKVAYLIWQKPIMSINHNTFINEILKKSGFENVFENHKNRYPEISEKDIADAKPEYIFLSSEPYPFKEKNKKEFQEKYPESKIILVDGEMFSWYGSRLIQFTHYFKNVLEKEL